MSEPILARWSALAAQLKPIFLRWEKLRAAYNAILLGLSLYRLDDPLRGLRDPWVLCMCLFGAVLANLCYVLGAVAECYCHWLGLRNRWVTASIFILGTLVSLPLVVYFLSWVEFVAEQR